MIGIEAVIGAAMPVIIEFIAKYVKSSAGKFIVSLVLPLIAGVAINFKGLSFDNVEAIINMVSKIRIPMSTGPRKVSMQR